MADGWLSRFRRHPKVPASMRVDDIAPSDRDDMEMFTCRQCGRHIHSHAPSNKAQEACATRSGRVWLAPDGKTLHPFTTCRTSHLTSGPPDDRKANRLLVYVTGRSPLEGYGPPAAQAAIRDRPVEREQNSGRRPFSSTAGGGLLRPP